MRFFVIAASLAVLAAPAVQANASMAQSSSQVRASDSAQDETVGTVTGEKVICRRDKEIGSRVKARKVCMTEAQWAVKTAEERAYLEQRQAQRTASGN